ncbi:MAG TPA: CHRD domain-containing protein, partial [Usitatibacter sp.]|nr:CHRD domain-containing protein [Usitatibacter sp.]
MYKLSRCLLVLAVFVVSASANAAMVFMKATLANEVGVVGNGEGSAFVSVDTTTHTVSWAVNFRNLTSQYTISHFHGPTAPGGQAGVQVFIDAGGSSPLVGSAILTTQQEADLLAGLYYINLHTANFPNGEIRGTVVPIDTNFYDVFTSAAGGIVASDHLNGTVTLDPATLMLSWNIAWG